MALLPCIFSYTDDPHALQINNYTRYVEIRRGICDSPDVCGNNQCPFYDRSQEATKIFIESAFYSRSLDGLKHSKSTDIEIYYALIELAGLKKPQKLG